MITTAGFGNRRRNTAQRLVARSDAKGKGAAAMDKNPPINHLATGESSGTQMKAIIAGGGIGGTTAAICLAQSGWQVEVLEQAPRIEEIGAGVQISPNGARILQGIGVMPHLKDRLFEPPAIEMRIGATGRKVFSIPMKKAAKGRWGAPYFQIHRADLLDGLHRTLAETGRAKVHVNARVEGYETQGAKSAAIMADGSAHECDLLVGADGLHSNIRAAMTGPDAPRYTGNAAWRAVLPASELGPLAPPLSGCIWTGPGKHAVTTRIRGGDLVNFVGVVEVPASDAEGWSIEGDRQQALADFGGWSEMFTQIITRAPRLYRWALFDRAPLPRWSDGTTVLLGDAAHPMLPMMAQGAVQAIEDGYVLARQLERKGDIAAACRAYFSARIDRTSKVQSVSAANARLFHRRGPVSQLATYGPMWLAGKIAPRALLARNDWLYGARFDRPAKTPHARSDAL